ncbi:MAG: 16S rRNA (guanine(527)-N(7))-methyltransferase RsmG [Tissierellia bacterium]|nr:16S rRNA (guanine(527)-N(7))-methyltransferase RsmG [Tissierellia bacterium]
MVNVDTLIAASDQLNIDLDERSIDRFILFKELLLEWNKKMNITSITEDVEVDIKHFIDSITPLSTGLFDGRKKVIDIGTGGGFPGIPLKIVRGDLDVLLLDSLNKRIMFLHEVIDRLGLKDIVAIHGRAEELGRKKEYRENYDIVISRAVAALNTLAEYCLPFAKVGGHFVSMKGPDIEDELKQARKAIETLGGRIKDVEVLTLPFSDIRHSLIVIEKIRETPTRYPRGGGNPKKRPL